MALFANGWVFTLISPGWVWQPFHDKSISLLWILKNINFAELIAEWKMNWIQLFCQHSKHRLYIMPLFSTCASQICRKCSRPVLSDKMPSITVILPGHIQQGFSMMEKKQIKNSGAARLLVENKDSPWLQDTAGIFKDNLKSATPTSHTSRLLYLGNKESMQISTRSKNSVEITSTMLST